MRWGAAPSCWNTHKNTRSGTTGAYLTVASGQEGCRDGMPATLPKVIKIGGNLKKSCENKKHTVFYETRRRTHFVICYIDKNVVHIALWWTFSRIFMAEYKTVHKKRRKPFFDIYFVEARLSSIAVTWCSCRRNFRCLRANCRRRTQHEQYQLYLRT